MVNSVAMNMLADLLDSDEQIGPTVRVTLERVLTVMRGQPAFVPNDPDQRRSDMAKRRVADGLRAASADELAELAKALRVNPEAMARSVERV